MLRLEVAGVQSTRDKLRALIGELGDMEGLWERYAAIMVSTEEQWFGSLGDGGWPPLAPSTIRAKARKPYWSQEPVRRSDLLMESLLDPAQAMEISQGRSTLGTFTSNVMTWGTDVTEAEEAARLGEGPHRDREYAHYHQGVDPVTGEPADYGLHPPERQVIPWPLPAHTQAEMEAANEAWVREAIERAGLAA